MSGHKDFPLKFSFIDFKVLDDTFRSMMYLEICLWCHVHIKVNYLVAQMVKNLPPMRRPRLDPWFGKIPWRREWLPTVFLLGEFHEQWSLVVYRLGLERIGHD